MSKRIPNHIKKNFIYKRIWVDIHREDENAVILWIGNVGKGKSTQAITFCKALDPNFALDRIVYSVNELLELGNSGKLKRGSAILFDEIAGSEKGADSRKSLSHVNQILSYITTTIRSDGYIIVYAAPVLSQIDKREKLIGTKGLFTAIGISRAKKESYAWFNWVFLDSKNSKVFFPGPIFMKDGELKKLGRVIFHYPKDEEFIKAYKKKKEDWKTANSYRWQNALESNKEDLTLQEYFELALKNIDLVVNPKKKVMLAELQLVLPKITERNAAKLRAILQNRINKGEIQLKAGTPD